VASPYPVAAGHARRVSLSGPQTGATGAERGDFLDYLRFRTILRSIESRVFEEAYEIVGDTRSFDQDTDFTVKSGIRGIGR
jgi:hypothetical protein